MHLPRWLLPHRSKKEKRNLTRFRNAAFDYEKFVRRYYLDKGNAYITAHVDSIADVVSRYSVRDYEWINPEFASFCEECAYYIPVEDAVILEISGPVFSEDEQEIITRVIQNYFGLKLGDKMILLDDNKRAAVIMLLAGLAFIAAFIAASAFFDIVLLTEMLLIIAWFCVWEFADHAYLQRSELLRQKLYAGQLCMMKIHFLAEDAQPGGAQDGDLSRVP